MRDAVAGWRFAPVVVALQALRGIDVVNAIGLVAEIGDFDRFEYPPASSWPISARCHRSTQRQQDRARQHRQDGQLPRTTASDASGVELARTLATDLAGERALVQVSCLYSGRCVAM